MNSIKVLHTGDVHLGYDYGGNSAVAEKRSSELRETFGRIIDLCLNEKVDVLLIAGDLFDSDNPNPSLVTYVTKQFQRIANVTIMISPGNHDYYFAGTNKNSYYDKISTLCENVFIFDGEMDFYEFRINNSVVRIYGAAFTSGVCRESLMRQRKIPRDIAISLGVFHGTAAAGQAQNDYNPISIKQIEMNCFDYLALGHIHKQTPVMHAGMTNYAYCGCPEGMSFGTQGIKGVYLGNVGAGYAHMEYVKVCKRTYEEISIELQDRDNCRKIIEKIRTKLSANFGDDYAHNLYRINLTGEIYGKPDVIHLERELSDLFYVEIQDKTRQIIEEAEHKAVKSERTPNREGSQFIINSIHIGKFGGLKDFKMDFNAGFNLIYGENEFGKTTIMSFIKMMLYGCNSKSKDVNQNLRKKYQPADGGGMSGNMRFTLDNTEYLVEKEFGRSPAFDIRHIYEINSAREIVFPKEYEVGDYFLGITEEEFGRTIFADGVGNYAGGDIKQGLLSKIVNLSAGIDEENNDIQQLDEINKEMEKLMSRRGTSGKIPDTTRQIDEYHREINRLNEEKENLLEQNREHENMSKRERKILRDLVEKIELADGEEDGDEETYWLGKKKFTICRIMSFTLIIAALGIYFYTDGNMIGKVFAAAGLAAGLIFAIKAIVGYRLMSKNIPAKSELINTIDVIKEEMGYNGYSLRELRKRLSELEGRETGEGRVIEKIQVRIEKYETKINELQKYRTELGEKYKELETRREEAMQTSDRLKDIVSAPLNDRAVRLFKLMTGDDYESIIIGDNYSLRIRKSNEASYREWKYLSTATAMQAYLCVRIALCELIGNGEKSIPVIMDDVINVCDDERAARTIEVLKSLDMQVILFTCHKY